MTEKQVQVASFALNVKLKKKKKKVPKPALQKNQVQTNFIFI